MSKKRCKKRWNPAICKCLLYRKFSKTSAPKGGCFYFIKICLFAWLLILFQKSERLTTSIYCNIGVKNNREKKMKKFFEFWKIIYLVVFGPRSRKPSPRFDGKTGQLINSQIPLPEYCTAEQHSGIRFWNGYKFCPHCGTEIGPVFTGKEINLGNLIKKIRANNSASWNLDNKTPGQRELSLSEFTFLVFNQELCAWPPQTGRSKLSGLHPLIGLIKTKPLTDAWFFEIS